MNLSFTDGTISQPIKVEMLEKTTPYLKLIQKGSISFRNGKLAKTCYITIVNGIPNQKYQLEMSDSNKIFQLMPLNELVFKLIQKVPIVRRADMEKLRVSLHDSGKALLTFADFDIKHEVMEVQQNTINCEFHFINFSPTNFKGDPTNIVEFAPVSVVPITVAVPDQPFTKLSLLNYNKDRVIYYLQMGNENGYFHVSTDGYVSLTKTAVAGIRNGQYSLRVNIIFRLFNWLNSYIEMECRLWQCQRKHPICWQ